MESEASPPPPRRRAWADLRSGFVAAESGWVERGAAAAVAAAAHAAGQGDRVRDEETKISVRWRPTTAAIPIRCKRPFKCLTYPPFLLSFSVFSSLPVFFSFFFWGSL